MGPAQERQRDARFRVHRHGAGDGDQRHAKRAGQKAGGRLHLVAQDQIGGKAAQDGKPVAAQTVGAARAGGDLGQKAAGLRMGRRAGQGGLGHAALQDHAGLGQEDRLVPAPGQFKGQGLEGAQVAVKRRGCQDGAHETSGR